MAGDVTERLDELLAFAHELADLAGPIARRHFRQPHDVETKHDRSPVTVADRAIEMALRERVEQRFPAHGIYGEEHGTARLDAEYVWVIDPIDGTKAFASGNPLFGTLVGLLRRGAPVVGVLDAPALGERYAAASGHGCRRRTAVDGPAVSLHTRETRALADAVSYGSTADLLLDHAGHRALRQRCRWASHGGDCLAYGWLAAGTVDVVVDTAMKPFDWCALVPIVTEAGGELCDWRGRPLTLDSDGDVIAAGTPALGRLARDVLAG
ncbi:MAG: inositol monophosphatase family protein [Planctomycetes bacterium]|nr:inositol monophosphatase family protein [Planctomycetota bacterium]